MSSSQVLLAFRGTEIAWLKSKASSESHNNTINHLHIIIWNSAFLCVDISVIWILQLYIESSIIFLLCNQNRKNSCNTSCLDCFPGLRTKIPHTIKNNFGVSKVKRIINHVDYITNKKQHTVSSSLYYTYYTLVWPPLTSCVSWLYAPLHTTPHTPQVPYIFNIMHNLGDSTHNMLRFIRSPHSTNCYCSIIKLL